MTPETIEQLRLAAKAAGVEGSYQQWDRLTRLCFMRIAPDGSTGRLWWNPFVDDGELYRLARATKLVIDFENGVVHTPRRADGVMSHYGFTPEDEALVIVRAAAEIGRRMP